jgi:hypothetical protein
MIPLQTLPGILGLGMVSGVNLYATVLVVGLCMRYGWLTGLPHQLVTLAHPAVLIVAAVLYLLEFVADKIPFVNVIWDAMHTFIRPVGGALLSLGVAANLNPVWQVIAFLVGGSVALGTHSTKMGFCVLAHTSPVPVTHSMISIAEDLGVVGLVVLIYRSPWIALLVLGVILLALALVTPLLIRVLRFVVRGIGGRILSWIPGRDPHKSAPCPNWLNTLLSQVLAARNEKLYYCFARSVRHAPRMKGGYLVWTPHGQWFACRRLFRTVVVELGSRDAVFHSGVIFDVFAVTGRGRVRETLYFTKDCPTAFRAARSIM